MNASNGWPGKPGWPLHPERDGWHWLIQINGQYPEVWEWASGPDGWCAEYGDKSIGAWCESEGDGQPKEIAKWYSYLGPVLLPDEAAALQKRCEEAERERDAIRRDASQEIATDEMVRRLQHLGDWQAADRIEALQARVAELEDLIRVVHRNAKNLAGDRTFDQCITALMWIDDLCRAAAKEGGER